MIEGGNKNQSQWVHSPAGRLLRIPKTITTQRQMLLGHTFIFRKIPPCAKPFSVLRSILI
jgi:hypothetical protein